MARNDKDKAGTVAMEPEEERGTDAVQSSPTEPEPPQPSTREGLQEQTDPVRLMALAGDENARRALGQPTTSQITASVQAGSSGDFTVGQPAPRNVYADLQGNRVETEGVGVTPDAGEGGWRGTLVVAQGDTVRGDHLLRLNALQ